jgi:hypothetical protein
MRLPLSSGKRLKRMANGERLDASDASARLVEEGLRRSEFAFIDFAILHWAARRISQGSSLALEANE